ncbi:2,3-bisphosphoglycerate-independent phosphoglycerate mutase [Nitzschia inconspicua]|uniref:Phosphoglycerate mutase n=1 Tax=Nitzschia inconspicua TaxID=303405 RepID=A0A9K3L1K5_9STRA|nr:2,3-bisphosphoglycerate-independent phosphoglycerate mutase [Nitzschia inconspicua]
MPGKDATLLRKATSRLMPECRCRWHLERQLRLFGSGDQRMELSNPPSSNVVLLRHGQSIWNKIPTFSGWCDVPLTDRGIEQAIGAARVMKEKGFVFDFVYTSALSRAYRTAEVIMEEMNDNEIAVEKAWQLNERHYGALQGLAKNNPDLMQKYGKEQLTAWRREMTAAPPPMNEIHPHWAPPPAPLTESLLDTQERVIKYWHETIVPSLRPEGKNALVSAHANTIRSLIAYLDDLSHDEVPSIHVPNSVPCLYKIDPKTGKAIRQDFSPLSKSKGVWILSAENLERLVEKLGGNSEAFARSVFSAWDSNNDGVLTKEEIMSGLSSWQRDDNPAIKALSGKLMEEYS